MNDHLTFLNTIRNAGPTDQPPSCIELENHLERRRCEVGSSAFMEFAYLQRIASETWGAERCAHFATVLREARVTQKPPCRTAWEKAEMRLAELPVPWQPPMAARITVSKTGAR
ncbi:hypothetical protein, partial [Antarctobacter jejuensis]|uniref:hypothetical protein n=1 Tax=Antarctobacter jejuensis TaxID=1439938 RepID=UPI003FD0FA74